MSLYFFKLKILFDELLNFETISACTRGAMNPVFEHQQRDWTMKFLMGLNDFFTNIKAQIILLKPTPTLSEVYALAQQEEKRKQISTISHSLHDTLAMATKSYFPPTRDTTKQFFQEKKLFRSFCKISVHSLETYLRSLQPCWPYR